MALSLGKFLKDFHQLEKTHNISTLDSKFVTGLMIPINSRYQDNVNGYSSGYEELSYNIYEGFKDEYDKYYESSADYYIKVYEEIKIRIPNSDSSYREYAKNYIKKKISSMKFNQANSYYKDKDYYNAINLFKECLNNEYITTDVKADCRCTLVYSLYYYGKERYENKCYYDAIDIFEEALKILNENYKARDRFGSKINDLKKFLGNSYLEIAKLKWSDNYTNYMEESIEYLKKAYSYNVGYPRAYQLYYYLYKAYYESKSNRTSNLDMARQFEDQRPEGIYFLPIFGKDTHIYDVTTYYNKSKHITELENQIEQKRNVISNLNYELNSINNNIYNTQSKINAKNTAITNKNNAIIELNNLADSLISKGNVINNDTNNAINEGKNQVEEVKQNIQSKKDFVEEISKLEKQKKEDIEKMKNNNKTLKQKNDQLILMLTALESKLN